VTFAFNSPDADIQALTEGVTSVTAFALNSLTLGLFNIKGSEIQNAMNRAIANGQAGANGP
jgi:hypothetical protein